MRNRNKQRITLGVTASLMLFSITPTFAESLTELESKKTQLEENASNSEQTKKTLKAELNSIEKQVDDLEVQLSQLVIKLSETEKQISKTQGTINETKIEIEKTTKLIKEKEAELEIKKAKLEKALRVQYSSGEVQLLEYMFRADNLSDFFFRYEFYNDIIEKGEKLHYEIVEELSFIETQKQKLEDKKKSLEFEKNILESHKIQQLNQKKEKQSIQKQLDSKKSVVKSEIEEEEKAINYIMASIIAADRDISNEKSRIAEAKRAAEIKRQQQLEAEKLRQEQKQEQERNNRKNNSNSENKSNGSSSTDNSDKSASTAPITSSPSLGNGSLGQPLASGTYRVSSSYGYRIHPVTGGKKLHNGTDYAAPQGTNIYAMEEGYVLYAGKANGYGNWIVIKHPNGLYTIYGHMYSNGVLVKPGEYVFRGQHIGEVGSAGTSTGNHLHFCVATSFNGSSFSYVNPLNYLN